jgi:uncharacterized membrane protein YqjE
MDKPATHLTVLEHQTQRHVFRVLLTGIVIVGLVGLGIVILSCLIILSVYF